MIDDVFRDKLLAGERLVWSDQPGQGIIFVSRDALMIPFSLLWGGFAIFWETGVVMSEKSPFFFKLWGIPFVLIGLYLIFGRFIVDAFIRGRMYYAVTNFRILIMRSGPFVSFTALNIDRLPDMTLTENRNGRGTIYFGPQSQSFRREGFFAGWTPSLDSPPKFLAIENARSVFGAIQRAARPS